MPCCRKLRGRKAVGGDNLSANFSPRVIQLAEENDFALPANSTHLTQPCDVSLFRPLKAEWNIILTEWKQGIGKDSPLSKDVFPRLLKKVVEKMVAGESICLEEVVQMEEKEEEEERKTKQANKLLCPKLMSVRFQG